MMNKDAQMRFLDYYRQLPIQKLAAGFAGVHENTIVNWKKEDKAFCDQIDIAASQWALENSKRIRNREWLLERIMKNHFAERKELTGIEGEPLVIVKQI